MTSASKRRALLLSRLALSALLLAAAGPKLLAPSTFAADLQNYRILPEGLVGPMAVFVPALELVLALGLLTTRYCSGAALLSTLMLAGFAVAMAQARVRGIDLRCGCFGAALEAKVSWLTVARSAGLAVLAALVTYAGQTTKPSDPAGSNESGRADGTLPP
jgi:hypothetical protein